MNEDKMKTIRYLRVSTSDDELRSPSEDETCW